MAQEDRLLVIDEVSTISRQPVATLRWLRHQGRGPKAAKLGRRLVYRESDVRAWIDEQFAADTGGQRAG